MLFTGASLSQYLKQIISSASAERLLERLTQSLDVINGVSLPFEATIFAIGNVNVNKFFNNLDADVQLVHYGSDGKNLRLIDFLENLGRYYKKPFYFIKLNNKYAIRSIARCKPLNMITD